MVLKCWSVNCNRSKFIFPLPLLMGFVIGVLSVYLYYLLLNCEADRELISVSNNQDNVQTDINRHLYYHQVDLTKQTINHNSSLLCLIFINEIDTLLMQQNVWLNKCGNNKIYVSKKKHKHINHIITNTYSPRPWKCYCQTLLYIHKKYNSGNIRFDWIFLAKDNIWLIYENLIHLVSLLNFDKHKHNYYAGQYIDGVLSMNAGVLLSINTLSALVHLFNNMDACNTEVPYSESKMLGYYLRKLNNATPIRNMDSYGCTLFHSVNLYETFNVKSLRPEILKKCMSRSAITFQLDKTPNHAIFYNYVLYKIRLVTTQDMIPNANSILPAPSSEDENIWRREAFYELNIDPVNMSQSDFFNIWLKKRKIIL